MATIRFDFTGEDARIKIQAKAQALVQDILALDGVCAAHLGLARSEVSMVKTRETELRAQMAEKGFDAVLLIEGSYRAGLEAAMPRAQQLVTATGCLGSPSGDIYETAFSITSDDMQG